jgi:hypothetical protein
VVIVEEANKGDLGDMIGNFMRVRRFEDGPENAEIR